MFELPFPFLNSRAQIFLDNFINNPQGKGSSYGGKRENIKKDLATRYSNILTKYNGKLEHYIFHNEKTDHYFFYFKIPSETYDKLYYDVVLEFQPDDKKVKYTTIAEYSMNFFSNSPHMTMTYTYILNKNKIIVDFLKPKYSKKALTTPPVTRNPVEQFGFEKSCYYAALYIRDNKLYSKEVMKPFVKPFDSSTKVKLLNSIMSQDQKFIQYQEIKRKEDAKKKNSRYKKVQANNIAEYNRVLKEINRKKGTPSKSKSPSNKFKSATANHKPFKSVINKRK